MGEVIKIEETIQKMIIELKNKVELMIDLAYSAVMLNDKEIAEEVLRMEEYIDWLLLQYEDAVLSLILRETNSDKLQIIGLLRFGKSLEEIADSAARIAENIMRGLESHYILAKVAEEGGEFVSVFKVEEGSILANKTISQTGIEKKFDVQIIAVRRGDQWIFDPKDDFVILPGDVLIIRGFVESLDDLRKISKRQS
ncbi:MAG: potassium channel family protein [Candidatus Njordarchaeales archaeon]